MVDPLVSSPGHPVVQLASLQRSSNPLDLLDSALLHVGVHDGTPHATGTSTAADAMYLAVAIVVAAAVGAFVFWYFGTRFGLE